MPSTSPVGYSHVFHGERRDEFARLYAFADTFDPFTEAHLAALDLPEQPRILEIGPGAGTTAAWMQSTLRPGELVLLDRDAELLRRLESESVTTVHADLTDPSLSPGEFDLIHARFVLMHLAGREEIAHRLATWLRPGGWLVLGDCVDSSTLTDHTPVVDAMGVLRRAAETVIGSDFEWARSFPAPLRHAGLVDLGMAVDVPILRADSSAAEMIDMTLQGVSAAGVAADAASPEEFDAAIAAVTADDLLTAAPTGLATAWGRKP